MEDLPNENIYNIALNLPVKSIINLCKTNHRFSRLCQDWYFWLIKAEKDLGFPIQKFRSLSISQSPIDTYLYIEELIDDDFAEFIHAIETNNVNAVSVLLNYIDPSIHYNEPLLLSVMNGYIDIVDTILKDPRVNPSDRNNKAIMDASNQGKYDIVNRLLDDPRLILTPEQYRKLNYMYREYEWFDLRDKLKAKVI